MNKTLALFAIAGLSMTSEISNSADHNLQIIHPGNPIFTALDAADNELTRLSPPPRPGHEITWTDNQLDLFPAGTPIRIIPVAYTQPLHPSSKPQNPSVQHPVSHHDDELSNYVKGQTQIQVRILPFDSEQDRSKANPSIHSGVPHSHSKQDGPHKSHHDDELCYYDGDSGIRIHPIGDINPTRQPTNSYPNKRGPVSSHPPMRHIYLDDEFAKYGPDDRFRIHAQLTSMKSDSHNQFVHLPPKKPDPAVLKYFANHPVDINSPSILRPSPHSILPTKPNSSSSRLVKKYLDDELRVCRPNEKCKMPVVESNTVEPKNPSPQPFKIPVRSSWPTHLNPRRMTSPTTPIEKPLKDDGADNSLAELSRLFKEVMSVQERPQNAEKRLERRNFLGN